MSSDNAAVERPRKLVVIFSGYAISSHEETPIRTDIDGYPQLVQKLRLPWIDRLSRIDRLVNHFKFKKDRKLPYEDSVEESYIFISQNYQPGDHVVLIVDIFRPDDQKALSDAAETLAGHLYNGSRPRHLPKLQSNDGRSVPGRHIPINCLIVNDANVTSSLSEWNDQLKSRFPPGIEHIICYRRSESYYSVYGSNGGAISREICFYNSPTWPFEYAARKVVYYAPDRVPQWYQQDPVWTQNHSSPLSGTPGTLPLESARPFGMYRHELSKYHDPDGLDKRQGSLVGKSFDLRKMTNLGATRDVTNAEDGCAGPASSCFIIEPPYISRHCPPLFTALTRANLRETGKPIMNVDTSVIQHPRKLIAYLYGEQGLCAQCLRADDSVRGRWIPAFVTLPSVEPGSENNIALIDYMIETSQNNRPQLVHKRQLPYTERSSRSSRLAVRVGLKKERKSSIDDTVEEAYMFLSRNYVPGDEVILRVDPYLERYQTPLLKTAETLARHLHGGTRPSDTFSIRSGIGCTIPARRIPIHCIAVLSCAHNESIATWNDELKSRFPPGIKHIVSWTYVHDELRSSSTHFDSDGSMISRELCFFRGTYSSPEVFYHATRDLIYFKQSQVHDLAQLSPVWTRVMNSSPGGAPGILSSESTKPAGMYHHELRNYDLPPRGRNDTAVPRSILVWKSSRH